jgi:hypothetical protein
VVSSLLISTSLQKLTNSFEVYSPPLFDLSIMIFLSERFSIKALNSLNFSNTRLFISRNKPKSCENNHQ